MGIVAAGTSIAEHPSFAPRTVVIPSRLRPQSQGGWPVHSLGEMLFLPPHDIARLPIGLTNLLCATDLPDTVSLNLDACFKTLMGWIDRVKSETERQMYMFRRDPANYENSEAYFRVLVMITVLQRDLGVKYDPAVKDAIMHDLPHKHSREVFLHGVVTGEKLGTCANMPVLYAAIGRMLNYPIYITRTVGHVFCRWHDYDTGERFNIEASGQGLHTKPDSHYYSWPRTIAQIDVQNGTFLRNLEPVEELSLFMSMRGNYLEDVGNLHEAITCHAHAVRLAPTDPVAHSFLVKALEKECDMRQAGRLPKSYREAEEANRKAGRPIHRFSLKGLGSSKSKGSTR